MFQTILLSVLYEQINDGMPNRMDSEEPTAEAFE